jgi:sugar phosphate isomerase/epimerase
MFGPRYIYCEQSLVAAKLPQMADLGLGVEVLFESTADLWPQVKWENLLDLADDIAEAGIEASVHGPFHNLSIGARDTHIRSYSLDAIAASLEAALAFHAPQVVFHTGYLPQFPPKTRERWLDTFSESLEQLLGRAAELGVRLAMENTYEPDTTLFEEIFARFPTPALGMCFDTSHATCFGRIDPALWSQRFADRICHIHCSDNDGRDDLHLGLGTGVVNFKALLQPLAQIGSSAGVTLEVSAGDAASSRDYLAHLVNTLTGQESS